MSDVPRLSVVMTTYQGVRYVREQLESIVNQSINPDEIVVSDDASTDETWEVLEAFAATSRVPTRLIRQSPNVGLATNVETALGASRGSIVVLADQDDIWRRDKLEAVAAAFQDPEVMVWFSDAALVDADGVTLGATAWQAVGFDAAEQAKVRAGHGVPRLVHGVTVTGATMAVRSTVLSLALPLPPEVGGPDHLYLHDGWLAVLGSVLGRVVPDETPYVLYRQHAGQFTAGSIERMARQSPRAVPDSRTLQSAVVRHPQLRVDADRVRLVLGRLRERDMLTACRDEALEELLALEDFLSVRTLPPGARRRGRVVGQLLRGRYSRYTRGLRTALKDLL